MKKLFLSLAAAACLFAAGETQVWNTDEVAKKLAATKPEANQIRQDALGKFAHYSMSVTKREASGIGELHEHMNDIFVVQSGECTLVTGGKLVAPKTTAPGEMRGTKVEGGTSRKIAAGDVVHIPANIPHQMLLEPGKQITYAVVKTTAP